MFCLLYSPKQKIVKFHAQKQIGKGHVIDIFTSEDMENISLCIFQYHTLYYIIMTFIIYMTKLLQSDWLRALQKMMCKFTQDFE
jgi:hypothetical protein